MRQLRMLPVLVASTVALLVAVACQSGAVQARTMVGGALSGEVGPLTGVPRDVSLLFSVDFRSGTLTPVRGEGPRAYTLTLAGLPAVATWFSDRPARDAGRVGTPQLFAAWQALGFTTVPPNAAVVLDHAPDGRDAMAVELHLRAFDSRTGTARFQVRALGSLSHGLASINRRLSRRLGARFTSGSLFIDNGMFGTDCTVGQAQLMDVHLGQSQLVTDMLPANGEPQSIAEWPQLAYRFGTTYGGDGTTTFGVPDMPAPSGAEWFICASGYYPMPAEMGGACMTGQITYFFVPSGTTFTDPEWLPAAGQTVPASTVGAYAAAFAPGSAEVTLPDLPAISGMSPFVCTSATYETDWVATEVMLFAGAPTQVPGFNSTDWVRADGQSLSIETFDYLYAASEPTTVSGSTFAVPDLTPPAPGLEYWIVSHGSWPTYSW